MLPAGSNTAGRSTSRGPACPALELPGVDAQIGGQVGFDPDELFHVADFANFLGKGVGGCSVVAGRKKRQADADGKLETCAGAQQAQEFLPASDGPLGQPKNNRSKKKTARVFPG